MRKILEKLGKYVQYQNIKKTMKKVVYDFFWVDEFEEYWKEMTESYALEHNE